MNADGVDERQKSTETRRLVTSCFQQVFDVARQLTTSSKYCKSTANDDMLIICLGTSLLCIQQQNIVKLKFHWDQFPRNFPVAIVTGKSPTSYEEVTRKLASGDVANKSARKLRGNWSQWNLSFMPPNNSWRRTLCFGVVRPSVRPSVVR